MIFRVQRKNADIYHQFYFLVRKKSLFVFQVKCVQYAFFQFFGFSVLLFFCSFVRQWIVRVIKPRNMVTIDEMWIRNYRNWNSWKRINSARQPVVSVIWVYYIYVCIFLHIHTRFIDIIWLQGVTMRYCWLFFGFEYAFLPSLFDPFTYIYFRWIPYHTYM